MFVLTEFGDSNFYQLVAGSKSSVQLVLPKVSLEDTNKLLELKSSSTSLELVTGYEISDFFYQRTDLSALRKLVESQNKIVGLSGLTGSFCLFDHKTAMVNSGPIVREGFGADRNYGVIVDNRFVVETLSKDYEGLISRPDIRTIDNKRLDEIEEALSKLTGSDLHWKWDPDRRPKATGLTGWTLLIFDTLLKIPRNTFFLSEVYAFEDLLAEEYPLNRNIRAKIRQQLQVLRDKSLVEFIGRGHYRKLPGLAGL